MTMERVDPSTETRYQVWGAAAGRCVICNKSVLRSDEIGEIVSIGELAHAVGATDGKKSPRGKSALTAEERAQANNLLLLCSECHKSIDATDAEKRYTVDQLLQLKMEHELRISLVTGIDPGRTVHIVRMVGRVRGTAPGISYDDVLRTVTSELFIPNVLPGQHRNAIELNLSTVDDSDSPAYFNFCADQIRTLASRVNGAVSDGTVDRLAIFAFSRLPLIVELGASLDDKVGALIHQKRRVDTSDAWSWPEGSSAETLFSWLVSRNPGNSSKVAIAFNLSGAIPLDDIVRVLGDDVKIYDISPLVTSDRGPYVIQSRESLSNFATTYRQLLAHIEAEHGRPENLSVFPAVPISAAFEIGRCLMPDVTPPLHVYDRGSDGNFFLALEVSK